MPALVITEVTTPAGPDVRFLGELPLLALTEQAERPLGSRAPQRFNRRMAPGEVSHFLDANAHRMRRP